LGAATLTGSVNLGGGDDYFRIAVLAAGLAQSSVAGTVDGGAGNDHVSITTRDNGVINLSNVQNFESIAIDTQTVDPNVIAHVSNANGYQTIVGWYKTLLSNSYSPFAQLWSGFGYNFTLASTSSVGHYGQTPGSTYNPNNLADITVGDAAFNLNVTNSGTILGAVQFYIGNDIYDGTQGTTGGTIFGYAGNDNLNGGAGAERIEGGFGNDILTGNGGADLIYGDGGDDRIIADVFDAVLAGGAGTDTLVFSGSGAMAASLGSFEALELVSGANLTLTDTQLTQGFTPTAAIGGTGTLTVNMGAPGVFFAKFLNVANTVTMVVNGTSGNDIFRLANAANTLDGGDGLDQIKGGNLADIINGGLGADKINGEGGADILSGGAGADVFKYGAATDSGIWDWTADRITDFEIGLDKLNFARIDARPELAGDQAFRFVGSGSFSGGAGCIRYRNSGSDLRVEVDIDGDNMADMVIILENRAGGTLTAADFVL
jgi:Ca2+-binding RTX toxin-like protein